MRDEEFDVSKYVKVHERMAEFREKYPEGLITTFRTTDQNGTSFKTVVCRNKSEADLFAMAGLAAASGHSYVDNEEYEEKAEERAETVSVGRALANLGIKIEKAIASEEEMESIKSKSLEDIDEENEHLIQQYSAEDDDSDDEEVSEESFEEDEKPLKSSRRFTGGGRFS